MKKTGLMVVKVFVKIVLVGLMAAGLILLCLFLLGILK